MQELRERVERLFGAIDGRQAEVIRELTAPDGTILFPGAPPMSAAEYEAYLEIFYTAFPDGTHSLLDFAESGDACFVEAVWTGTHTGPLATPQGELPPTGTAVRIPFLAVLRFRDGRIVSFQGYWDQLDVMVQMGLLPAPAAA